MRGAGRRKPGLTLAAHREMAAKLRVARETVLDSIIDIGRAYPVASPLLRDAKRSLDALDRLRYNLDAACYREHGVDL